MEEEPSDEHFFLLNPRILFQSDQGSEPDSHSSGSISLSRSDSTNTGSDVEDRTHFDTFDWQDAIPGNGWTPQTLARSSQGSTASTPSVSSSPRGKPLKASPDSLLVPSIEAALGARCRCRIGVQGRNCMALFDAGDIFRLRHARMKMSGTEVIAQRHADLTNALEVTTCPSDCRIRVNGHSICLQAYCMVYNTNYASMKRTWRNLCHGIHGQQSMGRPRGYSGGVMSTARGMQAYAWLKSWLEISADQDPVGQQYKYTINFIGPADLYEEYIADFLANRVGVAETTLSGRAFSRLWSYFKRVEKVRVRRKANTTTKCSSRFPQQKKHPASPPPIQSFFVALGCFRNWFMDGLIIAYVGCDELRASSLDPTKTRVELKQIHCARAEHRKDIETLRLLYVNDTQRAKVDHTFQTIAFDGTNSNSCNCPQNWRSEVRGEAADKTYVPQKIQSVLIHGRALLFYIVSPFVHHGMDLTVSCLVDSLAYLDPRTNIVRFQFDGRSS